MRRDPIGATAAAPDAGGASHAAAHRGVASDRRRGAGLEERPHIVLAAYQVLIAADALLYYWLHETSLGSGDRGILPLALAMAALAGFSLAVVPRAPPWALDASLAATSLCLALFAGTVPTGQEQLETALALVMVAVLIAYFLPYRAIAIQLAVMLGSFLAALLLNSQLATPLLALSIVGIILIVTYAVATLRASERQYRTLVDNATDVVITTDPDGRVTWVSPTVVASLGWTPRSRTGLHLADLFHTGDRSTILAGPVERASDDETPPTHPVVRVRTGSGEYCWVSMSTAPLFDRSGRAIGAAVALRIVDDLVSARDEARDERARTHGLLDLMLDPYALMAPVRDSAGRIVDFTYIDANESACASVGVTYGHLIGSRLLEHYPDASATGLLTEYVNVIATGRSLSLDDWAHPMADGLHYFDVRAVRVGDDLSHTWRDVSDRQAAMARLAASEAKYRLLAENATDIIFRIRGNAIEWVSPSIVNALGWPPEEVTGKDLRVLVHEADLPDVDAFDEALATGLTMTLRLRVRARDGTFHWVECHAKPYLDDTGVPDGIAASVHVVDSEVAAEQDLQWRVRHDELTGLVNRREALDRIGALRSHRQRRPGPDDGVLFCDVDSFKSLNDAHGHAVGDAILRSLSGRISASVRDGDLVARLGGDEFLIVLAGIHGLDEATLLAEGIRAAAAEPIVIGSHQIAATVSIGVTLAGAGESADSLIARADRAMYRAKQEGRNQTVTIAPN